MRSWRPVDSATELIMGWAATGKRGLGAEFSTRSRIVKTLPAMAMRISVKTAIKLFLRKKDVMKGTFQ